MEHIATRQLLSRIWATARTALATPISLSLIVVGALLWQGSAGGQTLESTATTKNDILTRIPGAILVVGYPSDLWLTRGNDTMHLEGSGCRDESWLPSISADGRILAVVQNDGCRNRRIPITLDTQKPGAQGVQHSDLKFDRGQISISPDGTQLASSRRNSSTSWNLQILDLRTGEISLGPEMRDDLGREISWSPDGRRFAFETYIWADRGVPAFRNVYAIYIFDTESLSIIQVGVGHSPAWSPSGEWIAFVGYVPQEKKRTSALCDAGKCYDPDADAVSVMKSDGTQARTLMTYRPHMYAVAPVWSPDSTTLLVNKSRNAEDDSYDIYLFDLATGKRRRISKNTMPVYAWVKPY
jgi:Tol biopolymer transport system component